jgi:hypothetical protein
VKTVRRMTGLQRGLASRYSLNWAVPQTSSKPQRCVKTVPRITRTSRLLGAAVVAMVLAGCADQPTSPVGPKLGPAAVGSIIKSSVVTSTTFCSPSGKCSTSTRYSEISEKVGHTSDLRAAMGISVGGGAQRAAQSARPSGHLSPDAPRKFHVSGLTLSGDAVNNDGSTSHIEFTGDGKGKAGARGKLSGIRLFRNGKPTLALNVDWKDVGGGVSYRGHSDLTIYVDGKVALHQQKEYSPIAVVAGSASDRSAATLTLSNDDVICDPYAITSCDGSGSGGAGSDCPLGYNVCQWLNSYSPTQILNAIWGAISDVGYDFANWWNSVWAHADPETSQELADDVVLAMDAYNNGGLVGFTTTLLAIGAGGLTDTLLISLGEYWEEWLMGLIVLP